MGVEKLLGHKTDLTQDFLNPIKGGLDVGDPVFDSESEGDAYLEAYQPRRFTSPQKVSESRYAHPRDPAASPASDPACQDMMPFREFVTTVTTKVLPDAFASEDSAALCETLKELKASTYHDDFVARAVRFSLDLPVSKQQWMSEVLTVLYDAKVISRAQVYKAFEKLIQQSDDISLDVPDAHRKLLSFLDCGEEDGVFLADFTQRLPETFLQRCCECPAEEGPSPTTSFTPERRAALQAQLLALREYKKCLNELVTSQFLVSGSLDDLEPFLKEMHQPFFNHEAVRRLIKTAMGRTNVEREYVSKTLSDLCPSVLTHDDIIVGFVRILGDLEDITVDVPEAPTLLAKFLVRSLADEILPPVFIISAMRLGLGGEEGRNVLRVVRKWVLQDRRSSKKISFSRFLKVWTAADPNKKETRQFKQEVQTIILGHFAEKDFGETRMAVDDLDMTPDQAVYFVRKLLELTLDHYENDEKTTLELLSGLLESGDIEKQTIADGLQAARELLPELILDTPKAADLLEELQRHLIAAQLLPMPTA